MIYTVFCPSADDTSAKWQSELLAFSWDRAKQPGELERLVADGPEELAPCHRRVRDVATMRWSPHPYTGDVYPPYQKAAALLEWLSEENVEGTVLLVEQTSVFCAALSTEVKPGEAKANAWSGLPLQGEGPFGLGAAFDFLTELCVDRTLELPAVTLPVLIHSSDLRKIVARWLELMSLIRAVTMGTAQSAAIEADKIAYVIAAAEARIPHTVAELAASTDVPDGKAPILDYTRPIHASDGRLAWEAGSYQPWESVPPDSVPAGTGRQFLSLIAEVAERRKRGLDPAGLCPRRQKGVRVGKILGTVFLEIPGRADTVSLNSSGAAIWEVCDGTRNLAEINQELETRFEMPLGSLRSDIEVVVRHLERIGALSLEP